MWVGVCVKVIVIVVEGLMLKGFKDMQVIGGGI
jgi:hypothetical protein